MLNEEWGGNAYGLKENFQWLLKFKFSIHGISNSSF
jgi:hypothetical protein